MSVFLVSCLGLLLVYTVAELLSSVYKILCLYSWWLAGSHLCMLWGSVCVLKVIFIHFCTIHFEFVNKVKIGAFRSSLNSSFAATKHDIYTGNQDLMHNRDVSFHSFTQHWVADAMGMVYYSTILRSLLVYQPVIFQHRLTT